MGMVANVVFVILISSDQIRLIFKNDGEHHACIMFDLSSYIMLWGPSINYGNESISHDMGNFDTFSLFLFCRLVPLFAARWALYMAILTREICFFDGKRFLILLFLTTTSDISEVVSRCDVLDFPGD